MKFVEALLSMWKIARLDSELVRYERLLSDVAARAYRSARLPRLQKTKQAWQTTRSLFVPVSCVTFIRTTSLIVDTTGIAYSAGVAHTTQLLRAKK